MTFAVGSAFNDPSVRVFADLMEMPVNSEVLEEALDEVKDEEEQPMKMYVEPPGPDAAPEGPMSIDEADAKVAETIDKMDVAVDAEGHGHRWVEIGSRNAAEGEDADHQHACDGDASPHT